ncbi:MAG: type II toxin-antitoxin system RelE/ParE family toxin [Proteobacteria bacterium]|nr:type II toxin-antitoxin system RelE/ParE family toxin [Pseudomonadota bacterium]
MPYEVFFAPEADDQLEELFSYIADRASVLTAERYTSAIVATCKDLSKFPRRGVSRDDIRLGLRVTHHRGRTIIAYAIDDATRRVTILGVFYGGQEYATWLDLEGSDEEP